MNKVYWLRRTAFILTIFALGMLATGVIPSWVKIAFPTIAMWWLMVYDDVIFSYRKKKVK